MKKTTLICISFLIIIFICAVSSQQAFAQAILESYVISHGGNQDTNSSGVVASLSDEFFGNGTAQAHITFRTKRNSSNLLLGVSRYVPPKTITFALLVFRIEVRGYDAAGELIYSHDLKGFAFGDSSSGNWSTNLENLQANTRQIRITFFGNYE